MENKSEEICSAVEENPENNLRESPIFKLNEDCLINIFKFLSIKDRIELEKGITFKIIFILYNLFLAYCNIIDIFFSLYSTFSGFT